MQEAAILTEEQKETFDSVVSHPIQSWAWGEFKQRIGAIPERIGIYEQGKMVSGLQVIFSRVPKTNLTVGYAAKCAFTNTVETEALRQLAKKNRAIFIKLEPDFFSPVQPLTNDEAENPSEFLLQKDKSLLSKNIIHGKSIFTHYDFHLDINRSEDELLASFHSKTRYNLRLAEKKGVTIIDKSTEEGIDDYVRLMEETTKRQGFFNHNATYFHTLFETFPKERMRVFEAVYNGEVLTAWILFNFNGKLYYPYGASSNNHREVMPNNLIMWEAIKYGKKQGCTVFDLWGCLGPNPDTSDSWYGFHKFKSGYNPQLVEYVGTYDAVYKPVLYKLFHLADNLRWKLLRLKNKH